MDRWEVSIELWESVREWGKSHGYDLGAGHSFGVNHPVHSVALNDIMKWNNARSEKEGMVPAYYEDFDKAVVYRIGNKTPNSVKWDAGYRLPTEAEWEKAARGGVDGKLYPWGTDQISLILANYSDSKKGATMPIGSYAANGYGLYDMSGNVFEWVWDWYEGYPSVPQTDPKGPITGTYRVIRGGSFYGFAGICGVASRVNYDPSSSNVDLGFRSVLPLGNNVFARVNLIKQPQSVVGVEGETVQITVTATGSPAPTYQWFKDGTPLPRATNATLTLANIRPAMIGDYTAVVSNAVGSVTSSLAALNIQGVDAGIWKDLVAYYPFNQNADDESGNGNDGKLFGGASVVDGRLRLNGSDGFFQSSKPVIPPNQEFTISMRFRHEGNQPNQYIELASQGATFFLGRDFDGISIRAGNNWGAAGKLWPLDGLWHGIAIASSANGTFLVIDGVVVGETTAQTYGQETGFRLGRQYDSWAEYFLGSIDDVRIYNRALSAAELESVYEYDSPLVPKITSQPKSVMTTVGQTVSFTVESTNSATFLWFKDGNALPGATNATLIITNVQASQIGDYKVVVGNEFGSVTSSVVDLNIPRLLAQQPAFLTNGLVAYYPFNGNANDESGNGKNGYLRPVAKYADDRFSYNNSCIELNGIDGVGENGVLIDHVLFNSLDKEFTLNIWALSADSSKRMQTLFNTMPHNGFALSYNYTGDQKLQYLVGDGTGWGTPWGYSTNMFPGGSWMMVTWVISETNYKVYVNGRLESELPRSVKGWSSTDFKMLIGCDQSTGLWEVFRGKLDDVRIYRKSLSEQEIVKIYEYERDVAKMYKYERNISINAHPSDLIVGLAQSASFAVVSTNATSYQWQKYGYNIAGATKSILNFTNVQPSDSGEYQVVILNSVGSLTSSVAKLMIKGVGDGVYQGMSFIPEGWFKMGGDCEYAQPIHDVFVSEYALDSTEVTIEIWEAVRSWANKHGYDIIAGDIIGADCPVTSITWYDSVKWCNARSEMNGITPAYYKDPEMKNVYRSGNVSPKGVNWRVGYRLPTEAEWERAARGGLVDKKFNWGSDSMSSYEIVLGKIRPVASFHPNPFGLYDMAGNVFEYTWNFIDELRNGSTAVVEYSSKPQIDPTGPEIGVNRSMRGGSWNSPIDWLYVCHRHGASADWKYDLVSGLRCVLPYDSKLKTEVTPVSCFATNKLPFSLSAKISGIGASYRWQKDGVDLVDGGRILGSGSETLTISGATLADAGQYRLRASNGNGSAVTEAATVTVWVPVSITAQPTSFEGLEGSSVQLSVAAAGFPAPTYQWFKGGSAIAGATNAILEFPQFLELDAGTYRVVASNVVGAVSSSEAVLSYRSALQVSLDGKPVTGIFRTLNPLQVELQFANKDWLMFYTIDGTDPDFASIPYVGPFMISEPANLRVAAFSPTFAESYLGKELLVRFLKPQIIDWGALPTMQFGDSATLNVSASSGLPVSVSFVSGPASWTGGALKALGAGSVVLRAIQAGDDVFAPVTSEKTLTIDPATQVLAWPTLVDKQFGNAAFGVQVTSASGLPVVLRVISGKAMVQGTNVTLTGAGEVILGATQAGTANYKPITEQRSFTVAKAEQTLTMASIANRGFSTQSFTPTAVSSSGLPVAFSVLSGPAQMVAGGVQLTGVGSVVLRASQSGSEDYVAAVPVDRTFTVSKGDQTLSFDSVGSKTFNDAPVTLSAKSSVGLPITFRVISGPGTLSGTQLTFTGAGTLLLQVLQAGNENYNSAAASQTLVVGKAGQSVAFPALANLGYSTNVIPLKATASSGLEVSYRVVQGGATVTSAGLVLSAVGNVSIAADQTGNTNYLAAATVTNSFVVSRGEQIITFVPVGDQVLGAAPVTLRATNSTGLPVLFQLLDGPATLSGAVLTLLGEGTVTLRAKQLGSPLYNAAQVDQTFVIRKLNTLTLTQVRGGSVTVDPIKDKYAPTETVTLNVKVDPGFEFVGWTGGLTGNQNPAQLVMSANRTVAPQFKDVAAPLLTWNTPAAGNTGDERLTLSGVITDNLGVASATWSRDGGVPKALVLDSSGGFSVANELLQVGSNTITLSASDAVGNKTTLERSVIWVPQRVLQIARAAEVQEGRRIVLPMTLSSDADNVAGLNFRVIYNPSFLTDPQLEWGSLVGQSVNSVNASIPGEVSGSFALAGVGLPTGPNLIATLNFRARSVPHATNVVVTPVIVGLGSPSGTLLTSGNATIAGQASIKPRRIKGDNNANDRLDIGDAVVISRLQVGLEEVRLWDRPLNDLNANGDLDNGDIIKALRTVVGLDPQPSPGSEGKRLAAVLGLAKVLVNTNDAMAIELLDGPKATVGQPYRVAVRLNRVKGNLSGLSFTMKYPASLSLTDKQVGALVPGDALPFWNESVSQVSLAAIRSTAWANATGVAAVLTFVPSAAFSGQAEWPLKLEQVEITGSGFDVRPVDPVAVVIQSGGGTVNTPPQISLQPPKADGSMTLEILATSGATVAVETTGDLNTWVETQRVTGQGNSNPVKLNLQTDPNVQAKFWRVRVR